MGSSILRRARAGRIVDTRPTLRSERAPRVERAPVDEARNDTRLRRSADVRAVLRHGARAHGRAAVVHARTRVTPGPGRWTVVAGRKVGGAVARNRAKRRLRAQLRAHALPEGIDLVVVARRTAVDMEARALAEELGGLVERARVKAEAVSA